MRRLRTMQRCGRRFSGSCWGAGEGVCMLGPVRFHYGCHTRVGNHCFMNFNFTVQDDAL